jgi:hypothetical protein
MLSKSLTQQHSWFALPDVWNSLDATTFLCGARIHEIRAFAYVYFLRSVCIIVPSSSCVPVKEPHAISGTATDSAANLSASTVPTKTAAV